MRNTVQFSKKLMMALMLLPLMASAGITLSDVEVFSGCPWQEVVIGYTISGSEDQPLALDVMAKDNVSGKAYACTTLEGVGFAPGKHIVKWNASADGAKFNSSDVVFTVRIVPLPSPLYCVIDLSDGPSAEGYPMTGLADVPSGGWTDEYKTTKLVLRKIQAGTFTMGSWIDAVNNQPHQVTLSKPFYVGVFEVTQKQYELVMGSNPSSCKGDMRPVERVSYDMIRGNSAGAGWPANNSVDSDSFLGRLRVRTGLDFDLPTEAQWECACRAGTTSEYNNGGSSEFDLEVLGRYSGNVNDGKGGYVGVHTKVGSYLPNSWGLYDMHGNVWEMCLDWYGDIGSATDPKGAWTSLDLLRINRGGGWMANAFYCRSSPRGYSTPSQYGDDLGFRLARTMSKDKDESDGSTEAFAEASSGSVAINTAFEDGCSISNRLGVSYGSLGTASCRVEVDGALLLESSDSGIVSWTACTLGEHVLTWQVKECAMTTTVNVVDLIWTHSPVIAPANGTIFDSSLTVSMSCPMEGVSIYYTLDGGDPTTASTLYKKFKISGKATVKAVAYREGRYSDVVTCEYALGRCVDPLILPEDGTVFKHAGQVVTIEQNGEEGVLRYTTDGTEPTRESPVYVGPFTVDDSRVVKAKVFSDRYFDSAVVTANLTREWETVATPVITAAEEFTGSETKVELACATLGAVIRYTTDGSEPNSHSTKYTGPFWVDASCTVKAVAMCVDYQTSAVATRAITKVWGIGDTMGAPDHAFATGGDAGFIRVEDTTAPNGEAMRSGVIGDSARYGLYSRSVLSTTVHGPCTLKFKWRSSCEEDDEFEWDHAEFAVDGEVKARINGVMDGWAEFTQVIAEGGAHTATWTYLKDDSEKAGADCLWVTDYSCLWTPTEPYTHESSVPVPYDWILSCLPHTPYEYDRFEAAARETAANGVNTVEEAYVAGLDPSNVDSRFVATIKMGADGKPIVSWKPPLNGEDEDGAGIREGVRSYSVYGKQALDDAAEEWTPVAEGDEGNYRFFKVGVGMPEQQ